MQNAKQRIRKGFCDITDTGLRVLSFVFIRDPLSHEQGGRRPERRSTLS